MKSRRINNNAPAPSGTRVALSFRFVFVTRTLCFLTIHVSLGRAWVEIQIVNNLFFFFLNDVERTKSKRAHYARAANRPKK